MKKIKMYWNYFVYVLEHKKNVFIECIKMGMIIHAFTHDMSKFRPSEFFPYANFFFRKDRAKKYKKSDETDKDFQKGWNFHQKRNKHHWNYWVSVTRKDELYPQPMPKKYVKQMICDWRGMSRKFGDTPKKYFNENKKNMILHKETVKLIKEFL